jgi:hypothetical protein
MNTDCLTYHNTHIATLFVHLTCQAKGSSEMTHTDFVAKVTM